MKTSLPLIVSIFLLLGCSSKKEELQGLWVIKHIVYLPDSEFEDDISGMKSVISFDRGAYKWKGFVYESFEKDEEIEEGSYKANDSSLFLSRNIGLDTLDYNIEVDTLTISGELKRQYNLVTERLVNYNLGGKESEFREFILSSSFMLNDSTRLEFRSDGKVITPEFDFYFGDKHLWKLENFENELFLSSDGYRYGELIHVKEFNGEKFKGIIYQDKKLEITFDKLDHELKYNKENLHGEWVEYIDERNPSLRLPPPLYFGNRDYIEQEELLISDSMLINKKEYRIDTLKWDSNREQDLIILEPKKFYTRIQNNWKIVDLSKEFLLLERLEDISKYSSSTEYQVQQKKFVRKLK